MLQLLCISECLEDGGQIDSTHFLKKHSTKSLTEDWLVNFTHMELMILLLLGFKISSLWKVSCECMLVSHFHRVWSSLFTVCGATILKLLVCYWKVNTGVFVYIFQSKDKRMRGAHRGCVKLQVSFIMLLQDLSHLIADTNILKRGSKWQ